MSGGKATGRAGLKLHVGCANIVVEGWENLDKSPNVFLTRMPRLRRALCRAKVLADQQAAGFPPGVKHVDAAKRLPYPSGSVAFVYSSHLIEHMTRWQGLRFLRECHRVLAPGGVVRTATPDLSGIVAEYVDRQRSGERPTAADQLMAQMGMFQDIDANLAQRLIRRNVSPSWHQWLYDAESLGALLREAGFTELRTCGYQEGEVPDLKLLEKRPESLFIEASR